MIDVVVPAAASPPTAAPFRLGIRHLLAWTLGSALILGAYRAAEIVERQRGDLVAITAGAAAMYSVPGGLALLCLAVHVRRAQGLTQPGHWIAITGGVQLCVMLAAYYPQAWPWFPDWGWRESLFAVSHPLRLAAIVALSVIAARKTAVTAAAWQWYFIARVAFCIFELVEFRSPIEPLPLYVLHAGCALVLLLVCARIDLRYGTPRDTLHWLGVIYFLGATLVIVGQYAAYVFALS